MARKRSRKRSKKNSRFINKHSYRRSIRRKDKKGKKKKTRKKNKRGGAHLPVGKGRVETLEEESSIMKGLEPEPDLQSEPLSTLSRLSSSRRVNVDEELLSDNNIGMISGHGMVVPELLFVVPDGIWVWVLASAGKALHELSGLGMSEVATLKKKNPDLVSSKFRKYGPGSLIQEQQLETLFTQGFGGRAQGKLKTKKDIMCSYSPSFILTGRNRNNIMLQNIEVKRSNPRAEEVFFQGNYGISMEGDNREVIENLVLSEHDSRIMPISELMSVNDFNDLVIETIKLSELFKKISEAQKKYADSSNPIPTNWVGLFCRSGQALNIDFLKENCDMFPGLSLDDSDFGGVTSYEQEGESQLTHQSSLSARRVPGNFKQIVEELYRLFNDNLDEANIPPNFSDKDHFKNILLSIKNKIDNIELLSGSEVCLVFLLRKLNL